MGHQKNLQNQPKLTYEYEFSLEGMLVNSGHGKYLKLLKDLDRYYFPFRWAAKLCLLLTNTLYFSFVFVALLPLFVIKDLMFYAREGLNLLSRGFLNYEYNHFIINNRDTIIQRYEVHLKSKNSDRSARIKEIEKDLKVHNNVATYHYEVEAIEHFKTSIYIATSYRLARYIATAYHVYTHPLLNPKKLIRPQWLNVCIALSWPLRIIAVTLYLPLLILFQLLEKLVLDLSTVLAETASLLYRTVLYGLNLPFLLQDLYRKIRDESFYELYFDLKKAGRPLVWPLVYSIGLSLSIAAIAVGLFGFHSSCILMAAAAGIAGAYAFPKPQYLSTALFSLGLVGATGVVSLIGTLWLDQHLLLTLFNLVIPEITMIQGCVAVALGLAVVILANEFLPMLIDLACLLLPSRPEPELRYGVGIEDLNHRIDDVLCILKHEKQAEMQATALSSNDFFNHDYSYTPIYVTKARLGEKTILQYQTGKDTIAVFERDGKIEDKNVYSIIP